MHEYFQKVITNLTHDDAIVLGNLQKEGRDSAFKAMKTNEIQVLSKLSTFRFKKSLTRLVSLLLIGEVSTSKSKSYFVTEYGQQALDNIAEKEMQ